MKTNNTDISFCISVYNVEDYIEKTIQSIIGQKHLYNFEIIIIDDCSTDNSFTICEKFSRENNNIQLYKNEKNMGVSYSRNFAIKNSKGKYIWFIDGDDLLYPNSISLLLDNAYKNDCDVLIGNYINIKENENNIFEKQANEFIIQKGKGFRPNDQEGHKMASVWSGIFKKSVLIENELFFNEKMFMQEDTLFFYELDNKNIDLYKCNINCYCYRHRNNSIMNSKTNERAKKYYFSMIEMHQVYNNYLLQNKNDIKQLKQKIHHCKQNIAQCLAMVNDKDFIKTQLNVLKKEKIYPYHFRKEALKTNENLIKKILTFLLPIKPFFWINHFFYKFKYK